MKGMKQNLIKTIVGVSLLASSLAAQAALTFTGSINFSGNFTVVLPPGGNPETATDIRPNNTPNALSVTSRDGKYLELGVGLGQGSVFTPNASVLVGGTPTDVFHLAGPKSWTVWSFTAGGYTYSLESTDYGVGQYALGVWTFLNVSGVGTVYIKQGATVVYSNPAEWVFTGSKTSTGATPSWTLNTSAVAAPPVPEPATVIGGALLLLPFGLSTYRRMRAIRIG